MSGQENSIYSVSDTLVVVNDTIFPSIFNESQIAESVEFSGAGLELLQKTPIIYPSWLFFYLFVLLGLFAWIRLYYGKILTQTVQASINFKVANRMFMDKSQLQNQLDGILYAFYFLSVAFLLFLVETKVKNTPYDLRGILLLLFNLALVVGIFFGRVLTIYLTGFLFNRSKIYKEYLYNSFIFNKIMGMALLPLLLFLIYTRGIFQDVVFWVTIASISVIVIMRLIRGVVFSFKKDILLFYMFLYLCALEITPLVLLYRWLEGVL